MLQMKQLSKEVFYANAPIVHVGSQEINFLKQKVYESQRKRVRICTHENTEKKLHEMHVVYSKDTYIRANRHFKEESLHILEGSADFVFFDENGKVIDVVPLGDYHSKRKFYCRVPTLVYHTLLIKSDFIVIHEAIPGPYSLTDTVYAPWSPEESDADGVKNFTAEVEKQVEAFKLKNEIELKTKKISTEVYIADSSIVHIGQPELNLLKREIHNTSKGRVRICAHKNTEDAVQEMFIICTDKTYFKPSMHVGKEESMHVIEGIGDYVFFDGVGNVVDSIPLGSYNSGRNYYCRIPDSKYHYLFVHSDTFIFHETTEGPFKKEDTVFPSWAPVEDDVVAIKKFRIGLKINP